MPASVQLSEAFAVIKQTRRASAGHLQRQLRWPLGPAMRAMDELERLGVVGPAQPIGPREILVNLDTYELPEGNRPGAEAPTDK